MKKIMIMCLIVASLLVTACSGVPTDIGVSAETGNSDALAKCLTENGATMYGTEWCGHCKNQKAAFGESFKYVSYIDCDKNSGACADAGVQGYPTWEIDGELYPGEQPLNKLASLSGCTLE